MKQLITIDNDPKNVLRKVAEPVKKFDESLSNIIRNMKQVCKAHNGQGLAAPQIGVSKKIILVLDRVMINPDIRRMMTETAIESEYCLSVPDKRADVARSNSILITWLDESRTIHVETFDGIAARIAQHEIDHLEGRLIIDYL